MSVAKDSINKENNGTKLLVVVDMQNDFTTGVLGNAETTAVIGSATEFIKNFKENESDNNTGLIIMTRDTHYENYMDTQEGKKLPVPHCIKGTDGWQLVPSINALVDESIAVVDKETFGYIDYKGLLDGIDDINEITLIGVCTDICVISNAMILKATYPEAEVKVIAECCAGVTPESHRNALEAMKMCQITVIEDSDTE